MFLLPHGHLSLEYLPEVLAPSQQLLAAKHNSFIILHKYFNNRQQEKDQKTKVKNPQDSLVGFARGLYMPVQSHRHFLLMLAPSGQPMVAHVSELSVYRIWTIFNGK